MPLIGADKMTLEALEEYDSMMRRCAISDNTSTLAVDIWRDVLKELECRGRIKLVNGSYDDLHNALIISLRDQ